MASTTANMRRRKTTTVMMMMMMMMITILAANGIKHRKICRGTNSSLSHSEGAPTNRLNVYKQRYQNCTVVNGNLEIAYFTTNALLDFSFLKDIEEVTGYVLIHSNTITDLHLNKLRIIRGSSLHNCNINSSRDANKMCSLIIVNNYHHKESTWSLKQLELVSLQDVMAGNVLISGNKHLCFSNKINWTDILSSPNSQVFLDDSGECTKNCDPSCDFDVKSYCWGEGPRMCQNMTKLICSPQCDNRCSGRTPDTCCHKECAVGCTGPSNTDCLACRHFENDGRCEDHCPTVTVYDPTTLTQVKNPDGRYTYGSVCLKKCPAHLSTDNGACVKQCSPEMYIANGSCVSCSGPCPKSCPGTDSMGINSENIDNFKDCKIINGNLYILGIAFQYDEAHDTKALTSDQLDILQNVEEITGSLIIQHLVDDIKDLKFIRNLKIIRGIELTEDLKSLKIMLTGLTSLSLHSLQEISYGNVIITNNARLCFIDSINWSHIFADPDSSVVIRNNKLNCNQNCSTQCSDLGCWGPLDTECLSCRNVRYLDRCLETCAMDPPAYLKDQHTCERCHMECVDSCTGEAPNQCKLCKNVKDNQTCLSSCPRGKYPDQERFCQPCHANCGNHGCTGPINTIGEQGCNSCDFVLFGDPKNRTKVTECLNPKLGQCAEGYFKNGLHEYPENHTLHLKIGCKQCHSECVTCDEYGTNYCGQCHHFRQEDKCVQSCTNGFYPSDFLKVKKTLNKFSNFTQSSLSRDEPGESTCLHCDSSCLSCYGPKPSECYSCRNYRIYVNEASPDKGFNCSIKCPEAAPFKITKEGNNTKFTVCVADDSHGRKTLIKVIVPVVVIVVIVLAVVILVIVIFNFKKARNKSKLLTAAANLLVGKPPTITPSGRVGETEPVLTISEKDLRLGEKIGSGAFGSVYKGIWSPPNHDCRIYVAIKVAHGCFGNQTTEVLEEIRIMSTAVHENCLRILGFSLSKRIMIITQLMPYGCMQNFIKNNRDNIGSKVLLNWAMQIAKGMEHLESRKIVHRDLAARNVLVQNDNHVRITDFGLSKILENQDCYKSEGGKLPIKWLALESLQHKCFTHKSDVWSYGVTLWELFTFGNSPYEHVMPQNMVDFLEKGDRLAQPSICTIDVYMVMIKCWVPNADDRPSFKSLVDTFTVMARDPARFLVITNDENKELKSTEPLQMLRQISTIDDEKPVIGAEEYFQRSDKKNSDQLEQEEEMIQINMPNKTREICMEAQKIPTAMEMSKSLHGIKSARIHKKANGQVSFTKKHQENKHCDSPSPNSKKRYIDDPCLNSEYRIAQRPPNFSSTSQKCTTSDGDGYLQPELSPNGYPKTLNSPQRIQHTFENPQYFDLPSNSSPINTKSSLMSPNVRFLNNKISEPFISLVGQDSEPANVGYVEDSGPSSHLLGFNNDNNNEYYNDFKRPSKKNKDYSVL